MGYSEKQIENFEKEYNKVCQGLQDLMLQTVLAGQESTHAGVKEHLLHGSTRRLGIIKKSIENIFDYFPLTTTRPLNRDVLYDVQINLHAYVINLYGIFDNWAWAFVHRHDLLPQIGDRRGVGLFLKSTAKHLPQPLRDHLSSEAIYNWHQKYLKSYRDALAHRIPLYIPPLQVTHEEGKRFKQLESEKNNLMRSREWQKLDEIDKEMNKIGKPSFVFLHSYEEEPPKPVLLHPQLLCDGLAVVEFGLLYIEHWNEVA